MKKDGTLNTIKISKHNKTIILMGEIIARLFERRKSFFKI